MSTTVWGKQKIFIASKNITVLSVSFFKLLKTCRFLLQPILLAILSANLTDFAYPTRWTLLSCLNGKYVNHFLLTTAGLLLTNVNDKVRYGKAPENYQQLSPYASISVKPFTKYDVRFRCFIKTFFDAYFQRFILCLCWQSRFKA